MNNKYLFIYYTVGPIRYAKREWYTNKHDTHVVRLRNVISQSAYNQNTEVSFNRYINLHRLSLYHRTMCWRNNRGHSPPTARPQCSRGQRTPPPVAMTTIAKSKYLVRSRSTSIRRTLNHFYRTETYAADTILIHNPMTTTTAAAAAAATTTTRHDRPSQSSSLWSQRCQPVRTSFDTLRNIGVRHR